MKKIDNRFIVVAFIIIVVFFLYFFSGTMNSGMDGMHHENGWMNGIHWGWFPIIVILLGGLIGWLFYKKKN